ncbi:MAG: alpha/beta fold hydrolase [Alphaproteobacteria bacterium]|nr:alpha/beta fold hydrolase [Alphaproteobacteria bacterium]
MTDEPGPETPDDEEPRILARDDGASIAYHRTEGMNPGVVFMGGFMSDMGGTKAVALETHCRASGRAFLRFDYQGHGRSSGAFTDGAIGIWTGDALSALDALTDGPQVLVGSSMGGWIMLLAALARPDRVAGLVGLAAAPDFTEALMWQRFPPEIRDAIERDGVYYQPSEYGDAPYPITRALIEDGRTHLVLERPLAIHCPVRLIHGMRDKDVPWEHSLRIADALLGEHVAVTLVKDGDHRLSRDADLARLCRTVDELCDELG